jgi:hypothetical protein
MSRVQAVGRGGYYRLSKVQDCFDTVATKALQIVDVERWRTIVEVVATSTITATKGRRGNGPRRGLALYPETRGRWPDMSPRLLALAF